MDPRGTIGGIYKGEYYTLNFVHTTYEALGHMVSKKKIFYVFPIVSLSELLTPQCGTISDGPRGMLCRNYVKLHITMLHTKYNSYFGCCGFREEDFFMYFSIVSLWPITMPQGGACMDPRAILAGFIKRTTIHCYTQNMKALGLVVSEKKIFLCFPMTPSGQGPYAPQGHSWQDLKRGPLYIATHNI